MPQSRNRKVECCESQCDHVGHQCNLYFLLDIIICRRNKVLLLPKVTEVFSVVSQFFTAKQSSLLVRKCIQKINSRLSKKLYTNIYNIFYLSHTKRNLKRFTNKDLQIYTRSIQKVTGFFAIYYLFVYIYTYANNISDFSDCESVDFSPLFHVFIDC